MAYLAVLTADGGVPIFTRSTGSKKTKLPFAAVGALNGVHLFTHLRDAELKSAVTPDEKIIWKEYHDKLVLILITRDEESNDCHLYNLLDNIFAAMIMLAGIDILLKQGEVMRLQKTLVVCYPLVDYLLRQVDEDKCNVGDLTLASDCFYMTDTNNLQEYLNKFLDVSSSLYGCLYIKGKIAASSREWWTLTSQERVLICSYVNCLPKDLSREIVVYLPTSSPKNPNRLVTLNLLRDVEVCVLCSGEPSLSFLSEEARKVWMNSFDLLKVVANNHPRNISMDFELDTNILSLLFINRETEQSVCSISSSGKEETAAKSKPATLEETKKHLEALRTLYKLSSGTYFKKPGPVMESTVERVGETHALSNSMLLDGEPLDALEFYLCLEDYKCYAISEGFYQLYIVFNDEIPKYALRSVTHKMLKKLTENNYFSSN